MHRLVRSSAATWAIGYVLLGLGALVAFALPLWYAWTVTISDWRVDLLREDQQHMADVYAHEGIGGLTALIVERERLKIAGDRILLLADARGHVLAGNLPQWPVGLPERAGTDKVTLDFDGKPTDAVVVHEPLPGDYRLLVGRDIGRYVPLERRFFYGLATAVAVLACVGLAGGFLIRRELLSKAQGIQRMVSAIMQGDLRHRLPVRQSGDELDTLSQTINGMLDHIEHLVGSISDVSNSIAHDLRTPLAELRSRLEDLVLTRPPTAETYAEIEGAVADVDRVIAIFNALLRLAEIDTGLRRSGFVPIDAGAVAGEVVDFYEPAAEQKGVGFSYTARGETTVAGDPVLIAQALSNLIDNALKFVGDGGSIAVQVAPTDSGAVEITVCDNGPGIREDDRASAIARFYRGDASRGTPGVGLGLSIVDAVARLHGGTLELLDNGPGLRARVLLPRATLPATPA